MTSEDGEAIVALLKAARLLVLAARRRATDDSEGARLRMLAGRLEDEAAFIEGLARPVAPS